MTADELVELINREHAGLIAGLSGDADGADPGKPN